MGLFSNKIERIGIDLNEFESGKVVLNKAEKQKASTHYTQGGNTVLVYMAGRNNLSRALDNDLEEIKMYSAVNIIGSY